MAAAESLEAAAGEDDYGLVGLRTRRYAAMLPAPSDGCSSGGRGKAWGALAAVVVGPEAAVCEDDNGLVGRRAECYAAMLPASSDGR